MIETNGHATIDDNGEQLHFRLTRRKYGSRQWYCWVEVEHDGEYLSLGDPWPCRTPNRAELVDTARQILSALDEDDFQLCNDPPRSKAKFDNQDRKHQRTLIDGLDCLAGQQDLF
jgi:hypothetical protein